MAGMNEVSLIGYLGRDPELRYTQGGEPVATLSVATTRSYKGRDEKKVEETEWHRVVVWGKQAENVDKYLSKGSLVFVRGRLKTTKYDDKEGVTRYATDIVAQHLQFLDRGKGDQRPHPADEGAANVATPDQTPPALEPGDDDIPF